MGSRNGAARGRAKWIVVFAILFCATSTATVFASSEPPSTETDAIAIGQDADSAQLPTNEDMVKTFAQFEVEVEQRREYLESPEAVDEREASRMKYTGLTGSQAEQLLGTQFAEELQVLSGEPAKLLSEATLERPVGTTGAVVIDEGHRQLLEGTEPVRAVDDEGDLAKVDLTLEKTTGGYEPVNSLVELTIPQSADEGVELGDQELQIAQESAGDASIARPFGEMEVFYPEVEVDTDLLVMPVSRGVELLDQLRSEKSPETLRFHMQMPLGASLRSNSGAIDVVSANGSKLAEVPPPSAIDAQGQDVPVEMRAEGDAIVLSIAHVQGDFAYPILVDPEVKEEWYFHNWNSGENLQALTNGAWTWNTGEGASSSWVWGTTDCQYVHSCWGSGRGLYIETPSGTLPKDKWGQWSYSAPNAETYLAQAWVSPFFRDDHTNCNEKKYEAPNDYVGMWNAKSGSYEGHILYNESTKNNGQGSASITAVGDVLIIGMGTAGGIKTPCFRAVDAGGVAIWLEDYYRPSLTTSSTGQWMDTSPVRLSVSAYDAGLGVKKFKAVTSKVGGGTEEWWTENVCSGLYGSRCPQTWNLGEASQPQLNYSPAALPEGIDKLSVTAYDAIEKPSLTTNEMTIRVDHAAPTITLSGTLTEQGKIGTELSSYTILAEAKDGNPASETPAEARSGVTKLTIETDGKEVTPPYIPKCAGESNCGAYKELEVPAVELSAGTHVLKVKATDALGHVGVKELSFTTGDKNAPTLAVKGFPGDPFRHIFSSQFGASGKEPGQFDHPGDVALDAKGNLWVVDKANHRIQQFNESGELLKTVGSQGSTGGKLNSPSALVVDTKGYIWVTDTGNTRVVQFKESTGEFVSTFGTDVNKTKVESGGTQAERNRCTAASGNVCQAGTPGSLDGQMKEPIGIAVSPGGLPFVVEKGNNRVEKFNTNGEFQAKFGSEGTEAGKLKEPTAITYASNGNGYVWVADTGNNRIQEWTSGYAYVRQVGKEGSGNGEFKHPDAIEADAEGNVYVGDQGNARIQELTSTGEYLGKFGSSGSGPGQLNLSDPVGIAVDAKSNIWVTDTNNNRIEKWHVPNWIVGGYIESIEVSAADTGFGVTSLDVKLTNAAKETEVLEHTTQACPKGACSLSGEFGGWDLSEMPFGSYTLTVEVKDGAGYSSSFSRAIKLNPGPPKISLSGVLAERAGLPLNAASGDLTIKASETGQPGAGVKTVYVERDHQRVAAYPSDCSNNCQEVTAAYTYSAQRDGSERSNQSAYQPLGPENGKTSVHLNDVACPSANNCLAVGHNLNQFFRSLTLTEKWDGNIWSQTNAPPYYSGPYSYLQGISCYSASACTAVGYVKTGTEASSPLVERYNGSEWTTQTAPSPSGFARAYLYGVSCSSASDCWAVGKAAHTASEEAEGKGSPTALVEHWNGSAWTVASLGTAPTQLMEISCSSPTSCVAVSGLKESVVERLVGTTWSQQNMAIPSGGSSVRLKDVACPVEGACTAVGDYTIVGHTAPLAERWNGSSWVVQSTADPVGVIEEVASAAFEGVSCPTAQACTAVGTRSSFSETQPLIEGWDSTGWALQPVAMPTNTADAEALAVSCSGAFQCVDVGHYETVNDYGIGATKPMIQSELPTKKGQGVVVEAVDKYGNAESKSIAVDVPEQIGETPECSKEATSVTPTGVLSSNEAIAAVGKTLPTAVAASKATTDEAGEEEIDPTYTAPKPNLESEGTLAEGETSVTPEGGYTLKGIACISPAKTTSAATEAKVVNADAALFANTAPETDTVIRPNTNGMTVVEVLRGSKASTSVSWNVSLNPDESLVELPSGAVAITRAGTEGEATGETLELSEPEAFQAKEALNDAGVQLEVGEYQLVSAEAETSEEVVAVIAQPWVILKQGSIMPLKMEVQSDVEVPTEYTVSYTLPAFEPNFTPEAVVTEASASAVVNGRCLEGSPCGSFDVEAAAKYAEYWGNEAHSRNPYYHDFGSNNCTNFISQILSRGKMSYMRAFEHGDGSWWYQRAQHPKGTYDYTESWAVANILPRHLWQYGLAVIDSSNQPSGWSAGDILAEDWYGTDGKGNFDHLQFVVGTFLPSGGSREPLIANESSSGSNYSHLRWLTVKERIEAAEGTPDHAGWNRVPLAVKRTIANRDAKLHDPANLYGPGGVFSG